MEDSPYIDSIHQEGLITRDYTFMIHHSQPPEHGKEIRVDICRLIKAKCTMSDGSEKILLEPYSSQMFYGLSLSTAMDFAQSIELFREMGLTDDAEISTLVYGDTDIRRIYDGTTFYKIVKLVQGESDIPHKAKKTIHLDKPDEETLYYENPIALGDLDSELVADVNNDELYIFLRVDGEGGLGRGDGMGFTYTQTRKADELEREITYIDHRIVQPRFDQFLSAAMFELNPQEKSMLEDMINRGLKVQGV